MGGLFFALLLPMLLSVRGRIARALKKLDSVCAISKKGRRTHYSSNPLEQSGGFFIGVK
jgi:hypothetical protein